MPDSRAASSAPIVCVDLNGVLDTYSGWKGPEHWDRPRPGAREFLLALTTRGFCVVVFTTRHPDGVWSWLRSHGLAPLVADVTACKPPAHVFLDDRAVCFNGDFDTALDAIVGFAAHWERQLAGEPGSRSSAAR